MRHRLLPAFLTIAKHFEQTENFAVRLASAHEDILFLYFIPRRPFTGAIEQIRQEQGPPDLVVAIRPGSKLSALIKWRAFSFRDIL